MKNFDFSGDCSNNPDPTPSTTNPDPDATAEPRMPRHAPAPDDSYIKRQAIRDREHVVQYGLWTRQLSPEQRDALKALGVDKASVSYVERGTSKHDLADTPAASYEPDIAAIIDGDEADGTDDPELPDAREALRHFIAEILTQSNPRLTVECLSLILNLDCYEGESMTEIAKRHGISTEAVSKRCWKLCEKFKLRPSRAMYARASKRKPTDPESP